MAWRCACASAPAASRSGCGRRRVILRRVKRSSDRPCCKRRSRRHHRAADRRRSPAYQLADIAIASRDVPHEKIVENCSRPFTPIWRPAPPRRRLLQATSMTAPLKTANPGPSASRSATAPTHRHRRDVLPHRHPHRGAAAGARTAIVTVRRWRHTGWPRSGGAGGGRHRLLAHRGGRGRGVESTPCCRRCASADRGVDRAQRSGDRARRRVVGDLAGFAATIVRRGVISSGPTSLLEQLDSRGRRRHHTRRRARTWSAPSTSGAGVADTAVLDTLPQAPVPAAMPRSRSTASRDAGFFAWLERNYAEIFSGGAPRARHRHQLPRHGGDVARDERETGDRALLNLGHSFGLALVAAPGFSDRLFHGEGGGDRQGAGRGLSSPRSSA